MEHKIHIEKSFFDKTSDGRDVFSFLMTNEKGMSVEILTLGGIIRCFKVPSTKGSIDITLGFTNIQSYELNNAYLGGIIGRCCNRIDSGTFQLDGKKYQLETNNGKNHLHGGHKSFIHKHWEGSIEDSKLILRHTSEDGDQGYPGEVKVQVTVELTKENELIYRILATADQATPINITNHPYFNLKGHNSPNIYDHQLSVFTDKYTPKDESGIPTGEISSVSGTQFDLRCGAILGDRIDNIPGDIGYDHNFCFGKVGEKKHAARLYEATSGHTLDIFTDQPGLQVYTANYTDETKNCKEGATYGKHCSIAIEPQNYPNAINQDNFPSCVLRPGETYERMFSYKYSLRKV